MKYETPPTQRQEFWVAHSPYPNQTWRGIEKTITPEAKNSGPHLFDTQEACQAYINGANPRGWDMREYQRPVRVVLEFPFVGKPLDAVAATLEEATAALNLLIELSATLRSCRDDAELETFKTKYTPAVKAAVRALDLYLTGKTDCRNHDDEHAAACCEGAPWHVHLSDGGHSRLSVNLASSAATVIFDRGLSSPTACSRWEALCQTARTRGV